MPTYSIFAADMFYDLDLWPSGLDSSRKWQVTWSTPPPITTIPYKQHDIYDTYCRWLSRRRTLAIHTQCHQTSTNVTHNHADSLSQNSTISNIVENGGQTILMKCHIAKGCAFLTGKM